MGVSGRPFILADYLVKWAGTSYALTRSHAHTLTRSHAHTLIRAHAHTLIRAHAHMLTRSHNIQQCSFLILDDERVRFIFLSTPLFDCYKVEFERHTLKANCDYVFNYLKPVAFHTPCVRSPQVQLREVGHE